MLFNSHFHLDTFENMLDEYFELADPEREDLKSPPTLAQRERLRDNIMDTVKEYGTVREYLLFEEMFANYEYSRTRSGADAPESGILYIPYNLRPVTL